MTFADNSQSAALAVQCRNWEKTIDVFHYAAVRTFKESFQVIEHNTSFWLQGDQTRVNLGHNDFIPTGSFKKYVTEPLPPS